MTKTKQITTTLKTTVKNEAVLAIIVSQELVKTQRHEAIQHLAEEVTIKGFRKGKAPLPLIEKQLDPQKILDHTLNHLLPIIVNQAFSDHKLNPLGYPKFKLVKLDNDQDWELQLTIPIRPTFELGDYKKLVSASKPSEIILPDNKSKETINSQEAASKRVQAIFDALLKQIQFEIPESPVEEEVKQSLSRLLQQTQNLGLKIEDYLKSINKTPKQIRDEYAKAATDNLRLELILEAIAKDLDTQVTNKEIDELIAVSGDASVKENLDTEGQRRIVKSILRQRKTIDTLLKL